MATFSPGKQEPSIPTAQPSFKFNMQQQGRIRARGDGVERTNQYLIAYKSAQGSAVEAWWNEG